MNKIENSNSKIFVTPESLISILGVIYVHKKTSDGGDIYFTQHGLPYAEYLSLENWYEKQWFENNKEKLLGTGSVYKIPTKKINNKNIELVVKNCRVGEDVPLDTHTLLEFINAEFNSPWEEFALVMEMREGKYGSSNITINTQEPLAIYVFPEKMQLWQSGRSRTKINKIKARHPGIDLDILRQYKLIYGWIKGKNVVEIFIDIGLTPKELESTLEPITKKVIDDIAQKGYVIADMKPAHIIISQEYVELINKINDNNSQNLKEKQKAFIIGLIECGKYSVVDYELLLRTPDHEEQVKSQRRHSYLDDQKDRFIPTPLPSYLYCSEILGVPYVHGHVESTGGYLWVVGRNARLFDYFLPERWRKTVSWRLSENNEVFYTVTKDNIHIVWKTSRVGETPDKIKDEQLKAKAIQYGFNSPFEEFAIAQELSQKGIPTVYVRAIYMTGTLKEEKSTDLSRYESHKHLLGPDNYPILKDTHNYISIRGYYNGPDTWVAQQKGGLYKPIDLVSACAKNIITPQQFLDIQKRIKERLLSVGYDGSLLEANDILLALDQSGNIVKDSEKEPEARICNFELIKKIS
jgi:hypothetical protein